MWIVSLPRNLVSSLKEQYYKMVMDDECHALIKNNMWELVPRPPNVSFICSMWIFAHKEHVEGSFKRHKAGLIGDGKTQ